MGLEHEKQIVAINPKLPPGTLRQGLNTLRFNNGVEDLEVTSNAEGNSYHSRNICNILDS